MIGNDLVDLLTAQEESNWQRPRFLKKIFTSTEIAFIEKSSTPTLAVWCLWSKKESVYKLIARLEKRRFFAPKKIQCLPDNYTFISTPLQVSTSVVYQNQTFQTKSFLKEHCIHTIAYQESAASSMLIQDWYLPEKDPASQSQEVRKKLLAIYADLAQLEPQFLHIQKDAIGIPYFYYKNKKQATAISLSHHGNYVGFAMAVIHSN